MTEIGRAFYNIKKLRYIAFRYNQLTDVDLNGFVRANPHLRSIYMEFNHFQFKNPAKRGETFPNDLRGLFLWNNSISNSDFLDHLEAFKDLTYIDVAINNITQVDGLKDIRQKFPKLQSLLYVGNPFSCSWLRKSALDRKMFPIPVHRKPELDSSDYSAVDGVRCKK